MAMIEATQEGMPTREGDLSVESHGMEPIPESARYGSVNRIFTVWFTPNLVPAAFFIGTLVTLDFLKLGFVTAILAVVVGNLVGAFFVALLSTMGPKLGLAQMPAARLPFGKTIAVPGLLNWFSTIGWDGINSVFGAVALTLLFPGLPFIVGLVVIVICQAALGILGYEAIHTFEKWGAIVLGAMFVVLTIVDPGQGRHVLHRWLLGRGPDRRLHRHGCHRRQLRAGMVTVCLGLLEISALEHVDEQGLLVHPGGDGPRLGLARDPRRDGRHESGVRGRRVERHDLRPPGRERRPHSRLRDGRHLHRDDCGQCDERLHRLALTPGSWLQDQADLFGGHRGRPRLWVHPRASSTTATSRATSSTSSCSSATGSPRSWALSWPTGGFGVARPIRTRVVDFAKLHTGTIGLVALVVGFAVGIPFEASSLGYSWGGPFNYITANYLHGADLAYYVGGAVAFLVYWFGARSSVQRT